MYSVTGHAQQYPPEIVERIFGHLLDQVERQHASMFDFALVLADEAQALLKKQTKGDTAMATEMTRTADPLAVVQAFDAACNANDVERALELFADDAVVTQLPPPPPPDPGVYRGKQQIRAWLEVLLQHFHVAARNHQVSGERVTWDATVSADILRHMGFASGEGTVEAVVHEGTIASFALTTSLDSPGTSAA